MVSYLQLLTLLADAKAGFSSEGGKIQVTSFEPLTHAILDGVRFHCLGLQDLLHRQAMLRAEEAFDLGLVAAVNRAAFESELRPNP